jgi:hypothetical protein
VAAAELIGLGAQVSIGPAGDVAFQTVDVVSNGA